MARLVYLVTHPITADCFLRDQLRYLREEGHEVHLVTAGGPLLAKVGASTGVTTHEVTFAREIKPLADLAALGTLTSLLERLAPDAVHASTPKAGLLGLMAARRAGVPHRLYLVRGLRLETARGFKRWLLAAAERHAARASTRIFCVSASLRDRYRALGLHGGREVEVLGGGSSNGVSAERFDAARRPEARAAARLELGLAPEAPVVGFVGRLTADKGIRDLIAAFAEVVRPAVPGAQLVLIGDFEAGDPVDATTRQRIADDPDIHTHPFRPNLVAEYSAFDVVAFPSYREGFPNVPLEAAACSLPVVGYRATGTTDAVVDGETGTLVELGDSAALGHGISTYLGDPELRRQHGARGRDRVERDFEPQGISRLWRDIYAALPMPDPETRSPAPEGFYARRGKRLCDVLLVLLLSPMWIPLALCLALAVGMTLGRPIFFSQDRPGRGGVPFRMFKFRTMSGERDAAGDLLPDSERLTTFGSWLRRSSLDEIPELWNVLVGRMSLVGPRPLLVEYLERYDARQARRHDVRPGITGWGQINGRNALAWDDKLELDVWYVEHLGFLLDLKILLRTLLVVVTGRGVSAEGHSTMPPFEGSQREDS